MPKEWKRRDLLMAAGGAALAAGSLRAELPDNVRVGLIGLDGHTAEATRVAGKHPQVRITAYAAETDRDRMRAKGNKALAKAKEYGDYRALLDSEELDAVCICDQNWRRVESVTECLERKIPTAAEKPMGISIVEMEGVEETAKRTGTPLTMLLPMRFDPAFTAMRAAVRSGVIGEPIQLSGQKSYQLGDRPEWMKERETFGGTIPYIACHTVDLLRFISGRDMVRTSAFHGHVGFPQTREMENTAAISYLLDNGGTATVRLDYLRPKAAGDHGDDRIRIAGSKGVIEYRDDKVYLMTDDEAPHELPPSADRHDLFADFLSAVHTGGTPLLTQQELFQVTRIVLRSREAADSGRVLDI